MIYFLEQKINKVLAARYINQCGVKGRKEQKKKKKKKKN
jgi:hypothetical protein